MRDQSTNSNSPLQSEGFIVTNSSEASINDLKDNLHVAESREKHVLKIPITPDPSVFAHEIRNPLTNINLAVFMLKAELKAGNTFKYIDIIDRAPFASMKY